MIHVQKVTLVAFALHDGKPPDTETLLVVLDPVCTCTTVQQENFADAKFCGNASRPSRRNFHSLYIRRMQFVQATPLPNDCHASSLTRTCEPGASQVSSSKSTSTKEQSCCSNDGVFLSCRSMQLRLQGQLQNFRPGSFFCGFYSHGCRSIRKNCP